MQAVIPLWKEVEYFKEYQSRLAKHAGRGRARRIVANAVYIVSIGTNDFLENYYLLVTGRFAEFSVDAYQDFLVARAEEFLTAIYRLGARRVTFAGLSAIGCVPLERTLNLLRGGGCIEEYNQVARDYNVKVKAMIARLRAELPGFKLAYINVYDNMINLINNPSKLGESSLILVHRSTEDCIYAGTLTPLLLQGLRTYRRGAARRGRSRWGTCATTSPR